MFDTKSDLVFDGDGIAAIKRTQEIPEDFLGRLRETREAPNRSSEFRMVCSIPVALVETWKAQGFDVMTAPAKDILRRLRAENLDAFITSKV